MATVNQVAIKILVDGKEMEATLGEFDGMLKKSGVSGQRAGGSIKQGFTVAKIAIVAAAAAVTGIIMGLNKAVNAASDFTEANNKMLVIFKSIPDAARAARDELVNAYHMSYREAAQLLAATGDVLTGLGVQEEKALELSLATQKLAADITSFSNAQGGAEAVAHALTSAMLGEREALKTYGMVIDEAMVKEELRAQGLDKLTGLALKQAKAEVTLEMALTQSKNAMGDTARTANDYASVQRQVTASMENLSMKLGSVFIPIWNQVLSGFLEFLNMLGEENVAGILMATWEVIKEFATRIWAVFSNIGEAIYNLLTGNFEAIKENMVNMWNAVAEGWDATFERIDAAYVKGGEDYKAFLEGSLNALKDKNTEEDEIQAVIDEERKAKISQMYIDQFTARMEYRIKLYNAEKKALKEEEKLEAAAAKKALLLEGQKTAAKIKLNQESLAAMSSIFGSLFGKSKAAAYAQAIINTWLGVTKVIGQTGIASPFAIPAILASGFAAAAQISATKYALGGEINQPTLALAGEAGPEIVAPKKTFIDVANQMIRGGQIGGAGNAALLNEIKGLREDLADQNLVASLDASEMAIIVERGNQDRADITF